MYESKARYSAFDTAVYYITFKDRTVKELRDKLIDKGYSHAEIEDSIKLLLEYGYLNDANYALSYIRSNSNNKGINRIRMELTRKGIDKSVISDAAEDVDFNETDTILDMMNRRYSCMDFSDEKAVRRMYGFFVRRGFKYENIMKAMNIFKKNVQSDSYI